MRVIGLKNKRLLALVLSFMMIFAQVTVVLADTPASLQEAKSIINTYYVDPVTEEVLDAPTISQMLKNLKDPWAAYYTPAEYQAFVDSLNNRFAGIGVHVEVHEKGILVTKVISGSPAESGQLKAGDIITSADGKSLAGLTLEQGTSRIKGEAGTAVNLTILRNQTTLQVTLTRQFVSEPTVTGKVLEGGIGYINISTFGSDTADEFMKVYDELKKEFNTPGGTGKGVLAGWIIDLRNNTGGYLSSAVDLGGCLFGEKPSVQIKDRSGVTNYNSDYKEKIDFKAPVIFLTNGYTASASELIMAAVKDYGTGLILGTNTYGKGLVQSMFSLSDGSVIKFTTARFYSPLGNQIQTVGIKPDLTIKDNSLEAACLLLTGKDSPSNDKRGLLQLTAGGHTYIIDSKAGRSKEFWKSMNELLQSAAGNQAVQIKAGTDNGWKTISPAQLSEQWPLYYSGYKEMGKLDNIPLNKEFTIRFSGAIKRNTVSQDTIELIDSATGKRAPVEFRYEGDSTVKVSPKYQLKSDTTYWLVIHPEIQGADGSYLKEGAVTEARTLMQVNNVDESGARELVPAA